MEWADIKGCVLRTPRSLHVHPGCYCKCPDSVSRLDLNVLLRPAVRQLTRPDNNGNLSMYPGVSTDLFLETRPNAYLQLRLHRVWCKLSSCAVDLSALCGHLRKGIRPDFCLDLTDLRTKGFSTR